MNDVNRWPIGCAQSNIKDFIQTDAKHQRKDYKEANPSSNDHDNSKKLE